MQLFRNRVAGAHRRQFCDAGVITSRLAPCLLALLLAGCAAGGTDAAVTASTGTTETADAATTETTADATAADTAATEPAEQEAEAFETREFFDKEAYLSAIDVGEYVTPGNYKNLAVTATETKATEEDMASMLEYYESQLRVPEDVTGRALQEGDTALLDYSGRIKETDEVFEGGTAQGQSLEIGSGMFIEGFEEGMIGMEIGDTRELELKFPDPYPNNADLAGVDVIFTVTLNGIQVLSDVTDEAVAALGMEGVTTVQEFRDNLKAYWKENAEAETNASVESAVIGAAMEEAAFTGELPEGMLERYIYIIDRSAYLQASSIGISTQELIAQTLQMEGYEGTGEEYVREHAEQQVKELLFYEAVARAEGLEPTEEEITEGLAGVLEQTGFATVEEYEKEQGLLLHETFRENLMALAVRKFLRENADVTFE